MLVKTYGSAVHGIDATTVTVETDVSRGIKFNLVGLPDNAVKESQQRIDSALRFNGYKLPGKKVVINWHRLTSARRVLHMICQLLSGFWLPQSKSGHLNCINT